MPQVSCSALVAGVRSGQWLISFPTDTVPALACRPDCADLIFSAKQRQADKPLILMAATLEALRPYIQGDLEAWQVWQKVAQRYWPGALTLVLPASDRLPKGMNPIEATTIGVRIPNWEMALSLLQQTGPLATTSVNLSGKPPLLDLAEVNTQFPQVYTPPAEQWHLPTSAAASAGRPSTVVKWNAGEWQLLRQGAVHMA